MGRRFIFFIYGLLFAASVDIPMASRTFWLPIVVGCVFGFGSALYLQLKYKFNDWKDVLAFFFILLLLVVIAAVTNAVHEFFLVCFLAISGAALGIIIPKLGEKLLWVLIYFSLVAAVAFYVLPLFER